MFGVSLFIRQVACTTRRAIVPRTRLIHASGPVFKKKRALDTDDMFDEFEIVDESTQMQPQVAPETPITTATTKLGGKPTLTPEERNERFSKVVDFMRPRMGRAPEVKGNYVRNSSWLQLLQLASTEEQLRQAVMLMPLWKDSGRKFNVAFSAAFVRRCQELRIPQTALEVFGNYAKFNLPLDVATGRLLLHSLHRFYPVEDLMTASALYGLYGLPPISQDFVSCSIIVDSCLRHNTDHSNAIAEALIPHLRQLKDSTPVNIRDRANRENVWVRLAVRDINSTLKDRNQPIIGPLVKLSAGALASQS